MSMFEEKTFEGQLAETINLLENKITALEAKLAERNAELILAKNTSINTNKMEILHLRIENEELKQQLAEKEEEIKQLNNRILFSQLQAPEEQRLKIIGSSCCQYNPNQDKILFAVEQLEKVKELAHNHIKEIANDLSEEDDERLNQKHTIHGLATAITDIDNQIKQLKEGK